MAPSLCGDSETRYRCVPEQRAPEARGQAAQPKTVLQARGITAWGLRRLSAQASLGERPSSSQKISEAEQLPQVSSIRAGVWWGGGSERGGGVLALW